jgi:UDP-N-acetylglucosamine 2-epimerase
VLQDLDITLTNTIIIEPVGYIEMLFLQEQSLGIITDSGGIQKESYILKKPCTTLRDQTEWIETIDTGWNRLSSIDVSSIVRNIESMNFVSNNDYVDLYGNGNTAQKIVDIIEREIKK